MILSISGTPGSGKTTVGKLLAKELNLKFYSMGSLRGKMAMDRGMDIDELNRLGETEISTDKEIDDYQKELGEKEDNLVIEGRLSWHFIPHSFKIYLICDPQVAADRVFEAQGRDREDERQYATPEETLLAIQERAASDIRRYQKHYGVDYRDEAMYDLVVDTTERTPEEVAAIVMKKITPAPVR